ncbi:MAG: P-II family nitrogen regulator [Thermoanaerobaculia bacterium]
MDSTAPVRQPEAVSARGSDPPAYATIIVKPFRVEPVLHAIEPFKIRWLCATEVRGYGRQKGHLELYKGSEYAISFIPKVKLEVVLPESELEAMCQAVAHAARTGRIGDGKIFLQPGMLIDLEPD